MKRIKKEIATMEVWIRRQYREEAGEQPETGCKAVLKAVLKKIGVVSLKDLWYRHRYRLRFHAPQAIPHNMTSINQ
jgi:hypothetical protein